MCASREVRGENTTGGLGDDGGENAGNLALRAVTFFGFRTDPQITSQKGSSASNINWLVRWKGRIDPKNYQWQKIAE